MACDDPQCPGWMVMNADPDLHSFGEGYGDIQRCDDCRIITDNEAILLARLAGLKVDDLGWMLAPDHRPEPQGRELYYAYFIQNGDEVNDQTIWAVSPEAALAAIDADRGIPDNDGSYAIRATELITYLEKLLLNTTAEEHDASYYSREVIAIAKGLS